MIRRSVVVIAGEQDGHAFCQGGLDPVDGFGAGVSLVHVVMHIYIVPALVAQILNAVNGDIQGSVFVGISFDNGVLREEINAAADA